MIVNSFLRKFESKNDIFDNENTFDDGLGYNQAPESESTRFALKIRLKYDALKQLKKLTNTCCH